MAVNVSSKCPRTSRWASPADTCLFESELEIYIMPHEVSKRLLIRVEASKDMQPSWERILRDGIILRI